MRDVTTLPVNEFLESMIERDMNSYVFKYEDKTGETIKVKITILYDAIVDTESEYRDYDHP